MLDVEGDGDVVNFASRDIDVGKQPFLEVLDRDVDVVAVRGHPERNGDPADSTRAAEEPMWPKLIGICFVFFMRLYRALRGCSCGSRGFLEDRMMDIITGSAAGVRKGAAGGGRAVAGRRGGGGCGCVSCECGCGRGWKGGGAPAARADSGGPVVCDRDQTLRAIKRVEIGAGVEDRVGIVNLARQRVGEPAAPASHVKSRQLAVVPFGKSFF